MDDGKLPCLEPGCGFRAKNKAGLGGHRRAKHPPPPEMLSTTETVRRWVAGRESHPLAVVAVKIAALVEESQSARDVPRLTAELRETLAQLGEPESEKVDQVDEVAQARARRRAAAAGGVGSAGDGQ